jgi:hypothetical protein
MMHNKQRTRRTLTRAVAALAFLLLGVQFVPVIGKSKGNPSGQQAQSMARVVDPQVKAILDRSCLDCHSDQTRLPWYGHVAPVSWLLRRDVSKGRAKLDFSTWAERQHSANERAEICDAVSDGSMPLRAYTLIHRNARLSDADVTLICSWAATATKPGNISTGNVTIQINSNNSTITPKGQRE